MKIIILQIITIIKFNSNNFNVIILHNNNFYQKFNNNRFKIIIHNNRSNK